VARKRIGELLGTTRVAGVLRQAACAATALLRVDIEVTVPG
jgi:hypothetical protein